jgi:CheY-like chemotaxis protein
VEREYDLFEQLGDGSPMWRGHAVGLRDARQQLLQLSKITKNECFAVHLPTKEIPARVNVRSVAGGKPVVFQVTYEPQIARTRSEYLRLQGYEVVTVHGNEAAMLVLSERQNYDLFIVGHAAPEKTRREMVEWLKANYPGVRIVALNPPTIADLMGADFNVKLNGPETLLPVIAAALSRGPGSAPAAG